MVVESFNLEYNAPEENGAFFLRCIESISRGDLIRVSNPGTDKSCMAYLFDNRWKMHYGINVNNRHYSFPKAMLEFYFKNPDIGVNDKNCERKGEAINCLTDFIDTINTSDSEWDDVREFFDGTLDIDFTNDLSCVDNTFSTEPIRPITCLQKVIASIHPEDKSGTSGVFTLKVPLMIDIFDSLLHDFEPDDYTRTAPNTTQTWLQMFSENPRSYVYLLDQMMKDERYRDLMRDGDKESSAMRGLMRGYTIPDGEYANYVMGKLLPFVFGSPSDTSVSSIVELFDRTATDFKVAWLKYCATHTIDIADYTCLQRDGSTGSCLSRLLEPEYYSDGSLGSSSQVLYKALMLTPEIHRGINFKSTCKRADGSETSCIDHILSWYTDEVAQYDEMHRLENQEVLLERQRWAIEYFDRDRDKKIARIEKQREAARAKLTAYKSGAGVNLWSDFVAKVQPSTLVSLANIYSGRRICRRAGSDTPVSCIDKVIDTYAHHVLPLAGSRDEEFVNRMYEMFTITGKECFDESGNRISCIQRLFDIFGNKDASVQLMKHYLISKFTDTYPLDRYDFRVHDGQQMQPVPNAWYILHAAKKLPKAKRCDAISSVLSQVMLNPDFVQKIESAVPGSKILASLSDCIDLREMYRTVDSSERATRRRANANTTNGQVSMSGEALTLATKSMCDQADPKTRRICADTLCWQMADVKKPHGDDDKRKWIGDDVWGMTNQDDPLGICGVYTVATPANVKDTAMASYQALIAKVNERLRSVMHNKLVSGVCVSPVMLQVMPIMPEQWGYDMPTIRVVLQTTAKRDDRNNPYNRLDPYREWASCADEDGIVAHMMVTYEDLAGMPLPSYVNHMDAESTRIVNGVTIDRAYVCRLLQRLIDDEDQQIRATTVSDDAKRGRIPKSLKQMIVTAVTSRPSMETDLKMVISRRPYDFMRASTCQEWSSCFNLDDGGFAYTTKMYLDSGAYIVYLAPDEFSTTWLCRVWILTSSPNEDGAPVPCVSVQPVYGLTEYQSLVQAAIDMVLAQHGVNRPHDCGYRLRNPGWNAACNTVVRSALDQCDEDPKRKDSDPFSYGRNNICKQAGGWKDYLPDEQDTYRDICTVSGTGSVSDLHGEGTHTYRDTLDIGEVGSNRLTEIRDEFGRQVTFAGFPKKVDLVRNRAPLR